jgi:hypothetical protein
LKGLAVLTLLALRYYFRSSPRSRSVP